MSYNAKFKKNENKRYEINNQNNNNDKKLLFSGTTKHSPTIIIHSSNEKCNNPVINNNENSTQKIKNKINNVHFGDDIGQDPQENSTKIFFQNVNGLEFNTTSHTLLATCIGIQDNQIDIACLTETNTNWNHYKNKRHLHRIVHKHWKRAHITTANIENKVSTLYQPGGTAIISPKK